MDLLSQSLLLAVIESKNQQQIINNTINEKKNLENDLTFNLIAKNNLLQNGLNLSNTDCINDESTQNNNTPILLPVAYHSNNEHSLIEVSINYI